MDSLKSTKRILEEMGFNPNSKESTQFAFLKHLKAAANATARAPEVKTSIPNPEPIQLEFDFDGPTSWSELHPAKKVSSR